MRRILKARRQPVNLVKFLEGTPDGIQGALGKKIPGLSQDLIDMFGRRLSLTSARVAGVTELSMLTAVWSEVQKAVANDLDVATFQARLNTIGAKYSQDYMNSTDPVTGQTTQNVGVAYGKVRVERNILPYHAETILRTNLSTGYNAGRWDMQRDPDVKKYFPALKYQTVGDSRVRDEHATLQGKTWKTDDAIWTKIYPPNGFNCRCWVESVYRDDFDHASPKTGLSVNRFGQEIALDTPDKKIKFKPHVSGEDQLQVAATVPATPGPVTVQATAEPTAPEQPLEPPKPTGNKLEDLKAKLEYAKAQRQQAEEKLKEAKGQTEDLKKKLAETNKNVNKHEQTKANLKSKISDLEKQTKAADKKIAKQERQAENEPKGKASVQSSAKFKNLTEATKWATKTFENQNANFSTMETRSLQYYAGSGYETINDSLRRNQKLTGSYKTAKSAIDDAFKKAVALDRDVVVYRGVKDYSFLGDLKNMPGKSVVDNGFMSTSLDPKRAEIFASKQAKSAILHLTVSQGEKAIWMESKVGMTGERELLLNRDCNIIISKVVEREGQPPEIHARIERVKSGRRKK